MFCRATPPVSARQATREGVRGVGGAVPSARAGEAVPPSSCGCWWMACFHFHVPPSAPSALLATTCTVSRNQQLNGVCLWLCNSLLGHYRQHCSFTTPSEYSSTFRLSSPTNEALKMVWMAAVASEPFSLVVRLMPSWSLANGVAVCAKLSGHSDPPRCTAPLAPRSRDAPKEYRWGNGTDRNDVGREGGIQDRPEGYVH